MIKKWHQELPGNKRKKEKNQVKKLPKDVFHNAERQDKATQSSRYRIPLTSNSDAAVLNKTETMGDARIKVDKIHWYVPHYTHSLPQYGILSKQILSKTSTELRYFERPFFRIDVIDQNFWIFELDSQQNLNVPLWIVVGFQPRDGQSSQNLGNDNFCRLPVTGSQCIIGTKKNMQMHSYFLT